jgi:hypothetical protein
LVSVLEVDKREKKKRREGEGIEKDRKDEATLSMLPLLLGLREIQLRRVEGWGSWGLIAMSEE